MIKNATTLPKRYYGMHMAPGLAEYQDKEGSYRILVNESTIKKMDKTFEGRPVYVNHVEDVNLEKIQQEADGYVVKSFYNEVDGKHWVEFIVVSDAGHQAISQGWRLSNAYIPTALANGGIHQGMEYQKEVMDGEYEHLAIVKNPRYNESIILTPEQFKEYCDKKRIELSKVANSQEKKEIQSMFKFFKREKVENSLDLENTEVVLPKSGKTMTVANALEIADKVENMHGYANGDHMVKAGEEEMSVNDMSKGYCAMKSELEELKKKNADQADADAKKAEKEQDSPEAKKNEDGPEGEKENADESKEGELEAMENSIGDKEEAKRRNDFFATLKNASQIAQPAKAIELQMDQVARGKKRYGSN